MMIGNDEKRAVRHAEARKFPKDRLAIVARARRDIVNGDDQRPGGFGRVARSGRWCHAAVRVEGGWGTVKGACTVDARSASDITSSLLGARSLCGRADPAPGSLPFTLPPLSVRRGAIR